MANPLIPPQSFTMHADALTRVIITPVKISKAYDPSKEPRPVTKEYLGIWDTGATGSVITRKVINDIGLKPIAMTQVHTAKGVTNSLVFLINMVLLNNVGISNIRATEGIITGDSEVLVGMDIISQGDFVITNHEGKTTCSFRCPSSECIDFVQQAKDAKKHIAKSAVGRNDPCPCGSGKKYKKCCGK